MSRLLIPSDKPLPEPTGDGLEGLPVVCWKIEDCAAHRCMDHTETPQLNETCIHDGFIECGACAYEQGYRDAQKSIQVASDYIAALSSGNQERAAELYEELKRAVRS